MNPDFEFPSEPSYTYYKREQEKRLEQTKRRGRRLSIVGIFQKELSFVYGLVIGGVDRKAYLYQNDGIRSPVSRS
jgi:putative transposase